MALPTPDAPLRLADGRMVYPGGEVVQPGQQPRQRFVEIPTHTEAQRIITNTRRKVSDLPELPKTMNAVGVILSYTMFGLDDEEIGVATGLSVEQIGRIKVGDAFTQMHEAVVSSVLDSESSVVRELLAKNAREAAKVMVEALSTGNRSDRISAAKDVLDRAGHRPADIVEHRHRMDGGLVIEIVRRDNAGNVPTIEMEP
jgi:hypothetical protein